MSFGRKRCQGEKERKFRIRNSEAATAVIFHTYVWDFNNLLCFNCCVSSTSHTSTKKSENKQGKIQKKIKKIRGKNLSEKDYILFPRIIWSERQQNGRISTSLTIFKWVLKKFQLETIFINIVVRDNSRQKLLKVILPRYY